MSLRNKIFLWRGDITKCPVDAIVNAANSSLLGGGGVDGAIHRAAGRGLLDECREKHGCSTGEAKITHAYNISQAKAIIHTVGPNIYSKVMDKHERLLASCYWNSLELAKTYKLTSIAFPCISTGVYSYPNDAAANVALSTVKKWLETKDNATRIKAIVFVIFMRIDLDVYEELMPKIFPPPLDATNEDNSFDFERSFSGEESSTKENKPIEVKKKSEEDEAVKMEVDSQNTLAKDESENSTKNNDDTKMAEPEEVLTKEK